MFGFSKRGSQATAAGLVVLFWIIVGTIVFHFLEPWTWIETLYFSVVTLTTIGYGDLHPTTDVARLVTVIYILLGVASVLSAFTIIGTTRVDKRIEGTVKRQSKRQK